MADVTTTCPACGKSATFSEYVEAAARRCPGCGAALELTPPAVEPDKRLRVNRLGPEDHTTLSGQLLPPPLPAAAGPTPLEQRRATALAEEETIRHSSRFVGVLVFLLAGGLAAGGQWLAAGNDGVREFYLYARYGLLAAAASGVLYEAFRESMSQGVLCLVVPAYIVFYALSHVESYWRQGLFLAAVGLLGAELHFVHDHSLLVSAQKTSEKWIRGVSGLINRAGDPYLNESPPPPEPPRKAPGTRPN